MTSRPLAFPYNGVDRVPTKGADDVTDTSRADQTTRFAVVPEWVLFSVSGNAVKVYGLIDRHADGNGHAFPSLKRLSDLADVSRDTIKRAIKELEDVGALVREQRRRGDGSQTSNAYWLRRDPEALSAHRGEGTGAPGGEGKDAPGVVLNESQIERESETDVSEQEGSDRAPRKARARDIVFDSIALACGVSLDSLTPKAGQTVGRAAAEIKAAHAEQPSLTPQDLADEVRKRAAKYRRDHPTWDLTPDALAKWWPTLAGATPLGPNDSRELRAKPGEQPREWLTRIRGKGLTLAHVTRTLTAEWGLGPDEISGLLDEEG